MFKKRNLDKKGDFVKDMEQIEVNKNRTKQAPAVVKVVQPNAEEQKEGGNHSVREEDEEKRVSGYGLIQKVERVEEKPVKQDNLLLNMYIAMRMEEISVEKERDAVDTTAHQILQMQKQYLSAAESKITEYDLKEVQKKLEKMATEAIKNQTDNRNKYLIELLQNEHERVEYASKKELKLVKQDRERLEKQLSSKYASSGRRHFVEMMRHQTLRGRE